MLIGCLYKHRESNRNEKNRKNVNGVIDKKSWFSYKQYCYFWYNIFSFPFSLIDGCWNRRTVKFQSITCDNTCVEESQCHGLFVGNKNKIWYNGFEHYGDNITKLYCYHFHFGPVQHCPIYEAVLGHCSNNYVIHLRCNTLIAIKKPVISLWHKTSIMFLVKTHMHTSWYT